MNPLAVFIHASMNEANCVCPLNCTSASVSHDEIPRLDAADLVVVWIFVAHRWYPQVIAAVKPKEQTQ